MINSKEIKKAALNKLDWKQALQVSAVFILASVALSYLLTYVSVLAQNTPILYGAASIIYLLLFLPLSFGFISSMSKLYEGKKINATTIFNDAILNFTKTIKIFLLTVWKMLLPSFIIIAAVVGILFLTVQNIPLTQDNLSGYSLYLSLLFLVGLLGIALSAIPYVLSSYILANNKDLKAKEIIETSNSLMENKKWNFVKLIISFLGWYIVLAVIVAIGKMQFGENIASILNWIGMFLLMPYLITSIRVFYEECNDEK